MFRGLHDNVFYHGGILAYGHVVEERANRSLYALDNSILTVP